MPRPAAVIRPDGPVVSLRAVGAWLVTLGLAVWLRSGRRSGPAEVLLRRLVCGRRSEHHVLQPQPVPL